MNQHQATREAAMIGNFIGVLFDGIAYGSLLFLISVGLSVTMGMMNFINLAHGAFAMVGGYVCVSLLHELGMPFLATLPLAFIAAAVVGLVLERTLYRRLYKATHLDQVLFSIGLTFMAVAGATFIFGPTQQPVDLPDWLRGQVHVLGLDVGAYRLFLIGVVVLVTLAPVLPDRAHPLRRPDPRLGRQPDRRRRPGHQRQPRVLPDLRARLRPGRPRRRPGHRRAGARPELPGQVHGVLPAGGRRRRRRHHQGPADRGADPRRVRRRRQILCAAKSAPSSSTR